MLDPYDAQPWINKCHLLDGELERHKNMLLRLCHLCENKVLLPNDINNFWVAYGPSYMRQIQIENERQKNKQSGLAKLTPEERRALGL